MLMILNLLVISMIASFLLFLVLKLLVMRFTTLYLLYCAVLFFLLHFLVWFTCFLCMKNSCDICLLLDYYQPMLMIALLLLIVISFTFYCLTNNSNVLYSVFSSMFYLFFGYILVFSYFSSLDLDPSVFLFLPLVSHSGCCVESSLDFLPNSHFMIDWKGTLDRIGSHDLEGGFSGLSGSPSDLEKIYIFRPGKWVIGEGGVHMLELYPGSSLSINHPPLGFMESRGEFSKICILNANPQVVGSGLSKYYENLYQSMYPTDRLTPDENQKLLQTYGVLLGELLNRLPDRHGTKMFLNNNYSFYALSLTTPPCSTADSTPFYYFSFGRVCPHTIDWGSTKGVLPTGYFPRPTPWAGGSVSAYPVLIPSEVKKAW